MKKLLLCGIMCLALTGCGVEQIDAGNRGVKTVWGEVQGESLPEGLYFYNLFSSNIYELDCKTQNVVFEFYTYTKCCAWLLCLREELDVIYVRVVMKNSESGEYLSRNR